MAAPGAFSVRPNLDDAIVSCVCCAGMPSVRGVVYRGEDALALYVAEPSGSMDYPRLRLGLVIGPWAEDSHPFSRVAVAFSCRPGPEIVPIDGFRPTEITELGTPLMAAETQAHPDFQTFLALAVAVIAEDARLGDMRGPAPRLGRWPQKFVPDDPPAA